MFFVSVSYRVDGTLRRLIPSQVCLQLPNYHRLGINVGSIRRCIHYHRTFTHVIYILEPVGSGGGVLTYDGWDELEIIYRYACFSIK